MKDKTNLSELAYCLPDRVSTPSKPKRVYGVAARFVFPGDSMAQSLARQQESFNRIRDNMLKK